MSYRGFLLALTLVVFSGSRADAQGLCSTTAQGKVACTITNVFGVNGLTPDGGALVNDGHKGHFGDDFLTNLGPLNASIGSQLGQLPLVSPASGLSFFIGKSGGLVASDFNFGPILTERAGTIGRHKLVVGFSYQYFDFDTLDGLDLSNLHSVYTHEDFPNLLTGTRTCTIKPSADPTVTTGDCAFVRDTIVTTSNIGLHVSQYTTFLSFGITSKFDISVAIPIVSVSMSDTAAAAIHNNGSDNLHQFSDPATGAACAPNPCFNRTFTNSSGATGIGDVTIRGKYNFFKRERVGISVGGDLRFPTGDSLNFLGAGAYGIKPFGVISYSYKRLSTNFNIGYEWNGKSYLAGNIAPPAGTAAFKGSIPNDFFFTFGGEIGIVKKLSAGVDYIGQHIIDAPRVQSSTFSELGACTTPAPSNGTPMFSCPTTFFPDGTVKEPNFNTFRGSYTASNISIGLRYRPFSRFLLTANVIRKLDDSGLRAKLIPLAGITYTH